MPDHNHAPARLVGLDMTCWRPRFATKAQSDRSVCMRADRSGIAYRWYVWISFLALAGLTRHAGAQPLELEVPSVYLEGTVKISATNMKGFFQGQHSAKVRSWCWSRGMVTELDLPKGRLVYVIDPDEGVSPWKSGINTLTARFADSRSSPIEMALHPLGHLRLIARRFEPGGAYLGNTETSTMENGATVFASFLDMDGAYAGFQSIAQVEVASGLFRAYDVSIVGPPGTAPKFEFAVGSPFPGFPDVPSTVEFVSYDFAGADFKAGFVEDSRIEHTIVSVRPLTPDETFLEVSARLTKDMKRVPPGDSEEILRIAAKERATASGSGTGEVAGRAVSWLRRNAVFFLVTMSALLFVGAITRVLKRRRKRA